MRRLRPTPAVPADLAAGLATIRAEYEVPVEFPAAVVEEAEAAARQPRLSDEDRRDIELFTRDPAGSRDLDQAVASRVAMAVTGSTTRSPTSRPL